MQLESLGGSILHTQMIEQSGTSQVSASTRPTWEHLVPNCDTARTHQPFRTTGANRTLDSTHRQRGRRVDQATQNGSFDKGCSGNPVEPDEKPDWTKLVKAEQLSIDFDPKVRR